MTPILPPGEVPRYLPSSPSRPHPTPMIEAVKLWNEPNNQSHWDFHLDPRWERFSEMAGGAARRIRALAPDLPIVFATGRSDSVRAFGILRDGDALVRKPYGPDEVLDAIRRVLGGPEEEPPAHPGAGC